MCTIVCHLRWRGSRVHGWTLLCGRRRPSVLARIGCHCVLVLVMLVLSVVGRRRYGHLLLGAWRRWRVVHRAVVVWLIEGLRRAGGGRGICTIRVHVLRRVCRCRVVSSSGVRSVAVRLRRRLVDGRVCERRRRRPARCTRAPCFAAAAAVRRLRATQALVRRAARGRGPLGLGCHALRVTVVRGAARARARGRGAARARSRCALLRSEVHEDARARLLVRGLALLEREPPARAAVQAACLRWLAVGQVRVLACVGARSGGAASFDAVARRPTHDAKLGLYHGLDRHELGKSARGATKIASEQEKPQ
jgi:hypothetical protein